MQIMVAALRAHNDGRRLGDILTSQELELVSMGCSGPNNLQSPLSWQQAGQGRCLVGITTVNHLVQDEV